MKNTFGASVILTLFGESHGESIGAVVDGLAPGIPVIFPPPGGRAIPSASSAVFWRAKPPEPLCAFSSPTGTQKARTMPPCGVCPVPAMPTMRRSKSITAFRTFGAEDIFPDGSPPPLWRRAPSR